MYPQYRRGRLESQLSLFELSTDNRKIACAGAKPCHCQIIHLHTPEQEWQCNIDLAVPENDSRKIKAETSIECWPFESGESMTALPCFPSSESLKSSGAKILDC